VAQEIPMSMRRYSVSIDDRSFTIDVVETAADRFEVSVDGRTFEATLHSDQDLPGSLISPEIQGPAAGTPGASGAAPSSPAPSMPSLPEAAKVVRQPPIQVSAPAVRAGDARADVLAAPMPGVVLEVLVVAGANLKRGDPVLILEAMKMRNTIRVPRDATVTEIAVEAGQPVGPGDALVRLGDPPTT
jgi:biotin carboxyl carrier protein